MNFYRKNSPGILALFLFLILAVTTFQYINYKNGKRIGDLRNQTMKVLIQKKSNLEKALYSRIYYTRGVAAFVSLKPDVTDKEYQKLARKYIQNDTVISTMALARNGVINAIYPLKGHEEAIGLDLLNHPERKEMVEKTIQSRKTFVAGPVELVEGGLAFISYTPIFDISTDSTGKFWGLTDIVIYKHKLIEEAGLKEQEGDMVYALRGTDGNGMNSDVFWGMNEVFDDDPVIVSIELPTGNWILAARPQNGWGGVNDNGIMLPSILYFGSMIIAVLLFFVLRGLMKIRNNEKEFKAIFNSMDTLIVEFDQYGNYIRVAPTNLDLLYMKEEDLVGQNVFDLFDEDLASLFKNTVAKCLKTRKVQVIDYPMEVRDLAHWFRARVSFHDEDRVLFNIYDITDIKKAEHELQNSKERLSKLNEIKDRYFSVIAHDLRNPIGSFINLTDLLLDKELAPPKHEQEKILKSINNTANSLGDMLENLLSWANSQQNKVQTALREQNVYQVVAEAITTQEANAIAKKITIENNLDRTQRACFDENLTKLVLRNLISNAIKFSYADSTIKINSETDEVGERFMWLEVADEGIGISESKKKNLFNLDKESLSYGTQNEKGSGLGLMLCKEFIEMQGGEIVVKSKKGHGTQIRFSIPLYRSFKV